ncbi:hypothetical protein PRIPAC_93336 [Pristionchus pacificus]|uniref:BTB domain-containing protein n=1 Tax=Pristionchus pacificus TaxID=54126 RepID=A0A2A6CH83_PRIPA|nr:hypothetical protein PRIPAC_93336 [Pristionchus pacificus]|eukprot:PDM77584.1 BTB domain-containing protein [Pristionchus pacificus]
MSPSPGSGTISLVVTEWRDSLIQYQELDSHVHRINGYPWRLRLKPGWDGARRLYLVCEKSNESELWQCTANIRTCDYNRDGDHNVNHSFNSWDNHSVAFLSSGEYPPGTVLDVTISPNNDGDSWRRRPSLDPIEPSDGILVIGEERKKVHVNKQALSLQSPFFRKLFNNDFKEKNLKEIPIGGVEYEEFCNIIRMAYGFRGNQLNDDNVHRVLKLADRFDLKIVEDRVVSYLLSSSPFSSFSIAQKLLLSEQYNLPFLTEQLLLKNYTNAEHKAICTSDESELLSAETVRIFAIETVGRMTSTPAGTISMVVKEWQGHHQEQYSPVHRINGYPWRLLLKPGTGGNRSLYLVCDKSSESALWQCNARVNPTHIGNAVRHVFKSWDKNSQQYEVSSSKYPAGTTLGVVITTDDDGESSRRYSSAGPTEPRDGIFVIGDDNKKVYVNKKEFCNIINMTLGLEGSQLDDDNVHRVLELADRFELKIIEDRVVSYLLSSSFASCLTIVHALLLAEKYSHTILKDQLLSRNYTSADHKAIIKDAELKKLSPDSVLVLYEKAGNQLP